MRKGTLIPVSAWWLLDEPLTLTMGVAGAIILGSVAFSQGKPKPRQTP